MSENKDTTVKDGGEIKQYTPEELAEKQRAAKREAERKAKRFKEKYLEFYDDIKQPENPSW